LKELDAFKVLYVDEMEDHLRKYKIIMEEGGFAVNAAMPPQTLDISDMMKDAPDIVLVDYELARASKDSAPVTYRGGTLATAIREHTPDTPIIILTRKSLLQSYRGAPGQFGAVDYVMYKDDFEMEAATATRKLATLVRGYQLLRSKEERDWDSLTEIIGARNEEISVLNDASPPLDPSPDKASKLVWSSHGVAKWIIHTLFKYPGILYDELHSASTLGIDVQSFRKREVQEAMHAARYDGPFHGFSDFWWAGRLRHRAFEILRQAGLELPLSENFARAMQHNRGVELQPSICVHSGEEHADTVCYTLVAPVMRKYSLEYYPDRRPPAMEPARVSFKAIRESPDIEDSLFSEEGRSGLKSIRED
jgi:CheY-like chemotaxis protein